jgi:DNA polymerase family B
MESWQKRIPHIVRIQKKAEYPTNMLFFDTETYTELQESELPIERQILQFGYAYAFRFENGKKTRERYCRFDDSKTFFDFLISRLDESRPLHVFAHNLKFDLTIVDFFHWSERNNFHVDAACFEDPPFFILGHYKRKRVKIIDTFNYWRQSVEDIGKSIRVEKLSRPNPNASKKVWDEYCKQDVTVIAEAVCRLNAWLKDNDLGSFGLSTPAIALSTFKHRFLDKEIYIHDNTKICQLERAAYYGGLVNCFYIGKIPKQKLYKLDVNSLYPFVMQNTFPVRLRERLENPSVYQTKELLRHLGGVAKVIVNTKTRTYPIRYNGRLCYCNGHFQTYLCGPELLRAIYSSDIESVAYLATYETAKIFNSFVSYFWKLRKQYQENDDFVSQYFCKIIMNSLYGKMGQMGHNMQELSPENLELLYQHYGMEMPTCYNDEKNLMKESHSQSTWKPIDFPRGIQIKRVNNLSLIKMPPIEHKESFPAIAAYVTAYAREYLLSLIRCAGDRNVYYCDTDSLFVNQKGYDNLSIAGHINKDILGKLKIEKATDHVLIRCPKDYEFGDEVARKGIRKDAIQLGPNTYKQKQFEGIKSVIKRGYDAYIDVKTIIKDVSRNYTKGEVSKSGWVRPYCLPEDSDQISSIPVEYHSDCYDI